MYTGELVVSVMENGTRWKLEKDFIFYFKYKKFLVKKGFETDFASIPNFLIPILGLGFKFCKANVLHDYLYYSGELSRKECDTIYKNALIECGISKAEANIAYIAVRLFGKKHYANKNKKNSRSSSVENN